MESVGLFMALGAGVLSFLSPCVLPLVPSYLSFITGMTLEDLSEGVNRKTTVLHSLLFIGGFTVVFVIFGASASFLGQFFRYYDEWLIRVGGVVIVLLGLHLAGLLPVRKLMGEARMHLHDKPVGYVGTVGVGAAFAAGWTPCIGPVLGGIITFAAVQETLWSGVGLLFVYSMGLAIPFLATALAMDQFLRSFQRFRRHLPTVQKASGVLLIVMGGLLLTGGFTAMTSYLIQYTPEFILERI